VRVDGSDGLDPARAELPILVQPDHAPCIGALDPPATDGAVVLLTAPRRFALRVVTDDLDLYPPPPPGDPYLGAAALAWSMRPAGATRVDRAARRRRRGRSRPRAVRARRSPRAAGRGRRSHAALAGHPPGLRARGGLVQHRAPGRLRAAPDLARGGAMMTPRRPLALVLALALAGCGAEQLQPDQDARACSLAVQVEPGDPIAPTTVTARATVTGAERRLHLYLDRAPRRRPGGGDPAHPRQSRHRLHRHHRRGLRRHPRRRRRGPGVYALAGAGERPRPGRHAGRAAAAGSRRPRPRAPRCKSGP
jgi:hypothetical protein